MKKTKLLFIILGISFILIPLFISTYSILRLISMIVGVLLLLTGLLLKTNKFIIKLFILPILISLCSYGIDYLCVRLFKTYPIIATEVKSSDKMKLYNGIFYRVYDCDGVLTVDDGYKKSFVCNNNTLNLITVNQFLENPKESYKTNHNKYVRLQGKVTKIVGTTEIHLSSYTSEESLNGYVTFDNNKEIVLTGLNIDPSKIFIYDNIEVIGVVTSFKSKNEVNTIKLTNIKILSSGLTGDFELVVNDIKDFSKNKTTEGIYYIGLEGIYYKYDDNNIYSIDYLLKDKRVKVENLIKGIESTKINDDNDDLYELEYYNIVICKNKDVIFVSKKVYDLEEICNMEE